MSDGSTRQESEEPFSSQENDEVGKDSRESLSGRLIFNNSHDLNRMSEILRNYYDNFDDTNYVLVGMYLPIMLTALVANILVIVVVFKNQYLRSVTNYFVMNLSVSDLLVTILCMPMGITQAISITWIYGDTMCKLFYYLQGVAVAASVFTITAMSIDRYLAIRSPISFRRIFTHKITIIVIVAIWLVSLAIFGPVLGAVRLQSLDWDNITLTIRRDGNDEIVEVFKPPSLNFCSEEFDSLGISARVFGMGCFVLVYAIPGLVVVVAYSMMGRTLCARKPPFDSDSTRASASSQQSFRLVRERKRVAWILLIMAILFALCWLPYNVLRLLMDFGIIHRGKAIADLLSYCLFLGHANSALNPVVYCFMTRNFRRNVSEILFQSCYITRRKPDSKTPAAGAGACAVLNGTVKHRKSLNRGLFHARQSGATTNTGCDSSCSRHSLHRHSYRLESTIQMQMYCP